MAGTLSIRPGPHLASAIGRIGRRPPLLPVVAVLGALLGAILVGQGLWIHAKALLAQVLLHRAFETSRATGQPAKPWSWADTWPVARITVPRLRLSAIVLAGVSGQALAFGPGHVEGTAKPGAPGVTVYAAHRDTHFSFLRDLRQGDVIEVTPAHGKAHRYRVSGSAIVPWNASGIDPNDSRQRLILATCWPFEAKTPGPLRYLVEAEPIGTP